MFQAPTASRGKQQKNNSSGSSKKSVQKETKSQRKAGGLKRGDIYEVEDVGFMYDQGGEGISVVPRDMLPEYSEESSEESETEEVPTQNARVTASVPVDIPDNLSSEKFSGGEDEEELQAIEDELKAQLHEWANDPGMPLDEQKRCVRQLLAQWHPDKNRHIGSAATRIFQFIQAEVDRIVASFSSAANLATKKDAERKERQAQRAAEKSAKASALQSARAEKAKKHGKEGPLREDINETEQKCDKDTSQEFSLVIGHGPATTPFLRPWPRSHITLNLSPIEASTGDMLLFGGEAYDGRELVHFSDLYKLNLNTAEPDQVLPWEKLYSAIPLIPGPDARSSHQTVVWDKFMFVFGGEWSSRDQKRYRQFNDLWRFDVTGGPGTRWERLDAGDGPTARSGHRMSLDPSTNDGKAVLFGGFSEDKKRRATYHDDLHILNLPTSTWIPTTVASSSGGGKRGGNKTQKPSARAGGLVWAAGGATYVLGGTRLKKKGGDALETLEDLWQAQPVSSTSSGVSVRWELLEVQGQGPGRRSGLSQCAVSSTCPGRRVVFGGVLDIQVQRPGDGAHGTKTKEVALFHNDVFLLDCESQKRPMWSRLWPPIGNSMAPSVNMSNGTVSPTMLPEELLRKGGGADVQTLVAMSSPSSETMSQTTSKAPRGRIAAGCAVHQGHLWIFGGACESGPRQEVTLDDLWRLPLGLDSNSSESEQDWECVLALSDRATMWFDDSSSDDEDEDEEEELQHGGSTALANVDNRGGGVLSKKEQKKEAHKQRMEVKQERNAERNEEKTSKRDLKKERQRAQALSKTARD